MTEEYIQHGLGRFATTKKKNNELMNNMTKNKKNPAPVLACIISGQARKTSHNYLNDKAKRLGVESDWLLNNYVSKYICSQLRAGRSLGDLQTTERKISEKELFNLVRRNSSERSYLRGSSGWAAGSLIPHNNKDSSELSKSVIPHGMALFPWGSKVKVKWNKACRFPEKHL